MSYLLSAVMGYLVGTVNPAFILAKLHGFDIREKGSRNAGASNAFLLFGKARGAFCAVFDIAKAAFIIWLTGHIFAPINTFAVTATACILGHIFPFYMRFKGGKGLACIAGTVLAYDLKVFAVMLAAELVIALATNYICFVPITASVSFPVVYGVMDRDIWGALLLAVVAAVVFCKHLVNLKRIRVGREARISYLWSRDKETARLKENYGDDAEE
ncbi:MAG: glycerol-3-phosphate acyltransferase [Clostridia bacterium]|nr:glycerol-3-phosphate acyltransferase [Clostridia bacterium]